MWVAVWLAMFAFAVLMTLIWAVFYVRMVVPMTSSIFAWSWLAFRSEQLITHSGGVEFTTSAPVLQYFGLFMATISSVALILWWLGDFPPEETVDEPEETPA